MVPMQVLTLVIPSSPGPAILVLKPSDTPADATNMRIVPIWIGVSEATQLGIALEHVRFARPMTHDLFLDALTCLDTTVDHVYIDRVEGSTFFSQLTLRHQGRLVQVDARPSDSISLALREEAPLYMDEGVLERSSFPYLRSTTRSPESEMEEFHAFISTLSPEDFSGKE